MKAIVGVRHRHGTYVFARSAEGCRELAPRQDLFIRRVPGFDWGSDSFGAAHLAAAIIAELCGTEERRIRQLLPAVRTFLACLPADDFEISESFLLAMIHAVQTQLAPRAQNSPASTLWQWIAPPPFASDPVRAE